MSISLLLIVVVAGGIGGFLSYRAGERYGREQTLNHLRKDLDDTIAEWNTRATAGEVSRSMELPGLHAVRRMLGAKL